MIGPRCALALVVIILLPGCSNRQEASTPLPPLDASGFLPPVAKQLGEVHGAASRRPGSAKRVGRLCMHWHAYEQYAPAEACYRRARELSPSTHRWAYYHGDVLTYLSRHADAREALDAALALAPDDVPTRLRLAVAEITGGGNPDRAAGLIQDALALSPDLPEVHYAAGRIYSAIDVLPVAESHYREALRLAGDFGAGHYALAVALRRQGRDGEARRHFTLSEIHKQTIAAGSDKLLAQVERLNKSDLPLIKQAERLSARGELGAAIKALQDALLRNPDSVAAHTSLVGLLGVDHRFAAAEKHFETAFALEPRRAKLHYNLGLARVAEGRFIEAEALFRKAAELDPADPNAPTKLGLALQSQGREREARSTWRRVLKQHGSAREAAWLLGRALREAGKPQEAVALLQPIVDPADRSTRYVLETLARAYRDAGNIEAAVAALHSAQDLAVAAADLEHSGRLRDEIDRLRAAGSP